MPPLLALIAPIIGKISQNKTKRGMKTNPNKRKGPVNINTTKPIIPIKRYNKELSWKFKQALPDSSTRPDSVLLKIQIKKGAIRLPNGMKNPANDPKWHKIAHVLEGGHILFSERCCLIGSCVTRSLFLFNVTFFNSFVNRVGFKPYGI
jgi:hypothetical protein